MFVSSVIYLQFVGIEDVCLILFWGFVFVSFFVFSGLGCQMSLCDSLSILLAPVKVDQSVRLAVLPLKRLLEINTNA